MTAGRAGDFGGELLEALRRRFPNSTLTHVETVPASPATYGEWPAWVEPSLERLLIDASIQRPFSHQAACAELAWAGTDVVIATGTSSGKSLGYQLPVLSATPRSRARASARWRRTSRLSLKSARARRAPRHSRCTLSKYRAPSLNEPPCERGLFACRRTPEAAPLEPR